MLTSVADIAPDKPVSLPLPESAGTSAAALAAVPSDPPLTSDLAAAAETQERQGRISKAEIRSSLKALTLDSVFASIFTSVTTGVLLSNFLLQLGATSVEIGLVSSIPMLANLLQPVGAIVADRTGSRRWYNLLVFGLSRLLWLVLVLLAVFDGTGTDRHRLVQCTLGIILAAQVLLALGSASYLSWMGALVPHRLRGRYFGLRNFASTLTNLLCLPLMGLAVSAKAGGTAHSYGAVLFVGVLAGLLSLACQLFITDVNPLLPASGGKIATESKPSEVSSRFPLLDIFKHSNFLIFLLYFGLWTFAVNLSAPFFNMYMLEELGLDVSSVSLYNSLSAAARLLVLLGVGKLADRLGNRPLLIGVCLGVAAIPALYLGASTHPGCVWPWLVLIHLIGGGGWGVIELCNNNIQLEIAPARSSSAYFGVAAAAAGIAGALGTTAGGFLAESAGGFSGLFILATIVRVVAISPLVFVKEPRRPSLQQLLRVLFVWKPRPVPVLQPLK
ncbi:MFS transporter [Kamptonema formosum]|uniref:MFS transporter n=1 Tax=Kamptonema formosum TaxID=331992 RepID=UPI000366930E|nr:MFS transporter [Oscillatoria sp. PCC 10802]